MKIESSRIVMGTNLDLNDLPPEGMTRGKYKRRTYTRHTETDRTLSPSPATTTIFGFKLQAMQGLGQQGQYRKGTSLWQAVLGSLHVGHGFEVLPKDFKKAGYAVHRYNAKKNQKHWGAERKFVFEKDVDAEGNYQKGIGRVGRIK